MHTGLALLKEVKGQIRKANTVSSDKEEEDILCP